MEENLKKPKTPKDERFIEALEAVKTKHNINDLDFVKRHAIHKDKISKIRTGLRSVKDLEVSILENEYQVNSKYIYFGEGPLFIETTPSEIARYEDKMLFDLRNSLDQPVDIDILKASYKVLYDKYLDAKQQLATIKRKLENKIGS